MCSSAWIYRHSFLETSSKRSFSVIENDRFGLVFRKTGSINSGTVDLNKQIEFLRVQYVNWGGISARERKNPSTGARGGGRMGGGGQREPNRILQDKERSGTQGPTFYSQSSTLTIPSPQEERQFRLEQGAVQITIVQSSDKCPHHHVSAEIRLRQDSVQTRTAQS